MYIVNSTDYLSVSAVRKMLFEGTKFWVAQRVPMRNHYLKVIRDNGGEVVPLEKQADLLIADHMRKDAVPGSISWTFIQDSVKNNSLESTADHVCGRPLGTVREAASAAPTKSTRTDYTAEDDRVAYKWGKEADERGASSRGNVIWKQLEVLVRIVFSFVWGYVDAILESSTYVAVMA